MFSFFIIMMNFSLVESFFKIFFVGKNRVNKFTSQFSIIWTIKKEMCFIFDSVFAQYTKSPCQQEHPATVKFIFVLAKYHILILKRWIVSFYSQLPKHMVRGQNWF